MREGTKSGVEHLERMKRGSGIKDRDDKSNGIEILMSETFSKINPGRRPLDVTAYRRLGGRKGEAHH